VDREEKQTANISWYSVLKSSKYKNTPNTVLLYFIYICFFKEFEFENN